MGGQIFKKLKCIACNQPVEAKPVSVEGLKMFKCQCETVGCTFYQMPTLPGVNSTRAKDEFVKIFGRKAISNQSQMPKRKIFNFKEDLIND